MMMMVVAVVTVATVPIIRPRVVATVVWLIVVVRAVRIVRGVRIIVPIRVISLVACKSVPNAEVHLSVRTLRRNKGQSSCHQCD